LKEKFEALGESEGIDVIVMLRPVEKQVNPMLHPRTSGHGLFTLCFLAACKANSLLNFEVAVVELKPKLRSVAKRSVRDRYVPKALADEPASGDMRALDRRYLDMARTYLKTVLAG
jgi:hypothetical protein